MKREIARLRTILSYELSGQREYEACDIPTRERISRLIGKILKIKVGV